MNTQFGAIPGQPNQVNSNMNNQFGTMSSQSNQVNPNMNNQLGGVSGQPNQVNPNMNISYDSQASSIQTSYQGNKKNKKMLFMIIGVVIAIVLLIVFITKKGSGSFLSGGHKNNTGGDYSANEVSYNCESKSDTGESYVDVLFDAKDEDGNSYQVLTYYKFLTYNNSNEKLHEIVDALSGLYCSKKYNKYDCKNETYPDRIDLDVTQLGWNTIVERKSNGIYTTAYSAIGQNLEKISKSEKDDYISAMEAEGYTCK